MKKIIVLLCALAVGPADMQAAQSKFNAPWIMPAVAAGIITAGIVPLVNYRMKVASLTKKIDEKRKHIKSDPIFPSYDGKPYQCKKRYELNKKLFNIRFGFDLVKQLPCNTNIVSDGNSTLQENNKTIADLKGNLRDIIAFYKTQPKEEREAVSKLPGLVRDIKAIEKHIKEPCQLEKCSDDSSRVAQKNCPQIAAICDRVIKRLDTYQDLRQKKVEGFNEKARIEYEKVTLPERKKQEADLKRRNEEIIAECAAFGNKKTKLKRNLKITYGILGVASVATGAWILTGCKNPFTKLNMK